jgi:biotin transporter BioY
VTPWQEGDARRARNRAWAKRHPLEVVAVIVAVTAGALWLRIDTGGQHTSLTGFLIYLVVMVVVLVTYAAIRIHSGDRSGQQE